MLLWAAYEYIGIKWEKKTTLGHTLLNSAANKKCPPYNHKPKGYEIVATSCWQPINTSPPTMLQKPHQQNGKPATNLPCRELYCPNPSCKSQPNPCSVAEHHLVLER